MVDLCKRCRKILERHLSEARKYGIDLAWFCRPCRRQIQQEIEEQ